MSAYGSSRARRPRSTKSSTRSALRATAARAPGRRAREPTASRSRSRPDGPKSAALRLAADDDLHLRALVVAQPRPVLRAPRRPRPRRRGAEPERAGPPGPEHHADPPPHGRQRRTRPRDDVRKRREQCRRLRHEREELVEQRPAVRAAQTGAFSPGFALRFFPVPPYKLSTASTVSTICGCGCVIALFK